ncbi:MAG: hypothetical protein ACOYBY_04580 [Dermatophilaceae bacterium]
MRSTRSCGSKPHVVLGAAVAVVLVLALPGCGSGSSATSTGSTTTTSASTSDATAAACADAAALKASLQALVAVKPAQDGMDALTTALANTKASLDAAVGSASAALQPAVTQVKTAFNELQTTASGATQSNLKEKAPAIAAALAGLGTAASGLSTAITQSCSQS